MREAVALPWKHRVAPNLFSSPLHQAWTFVLPSFQKASILEVELALVCDKEDRMFSGTLSISPQNNNT